MQLILEEKSDKHIKKEFIYDFNIQEKGLYIIEISSRARNWLQNTLKLVSFFKDDDLAVKIDNIEFSKLNKRGGLFDGEAAWNGNKLSNLLQINIFCIYLKSGKHTLQFIADQSPLLETIRIYKAVNEQEIVFKPAKNYPIEKGNRRPWLNFILIDVSLEKLKIQASANKTGSDDDDLQLRINGQRQTDNANGSHKYWYWCGRQLKGQSKIFNQEFNLQTGLHYIELWADNAPRVDIVLIQLNPLQPSDYKKGKIALYKDIVSISKVAQLRSEPSHIGDNIITSLEDGTKLIILEERVIGTLVSPLSNIWHKVKVGEKEGFVLSSFIEILGQERGNIINQIRNKSTELGVDPDLMTALAGCESRYKPYAVSEDNAMGIMQLTNIAIQQIAKDEFIVRDPFDSEQNIEGGIRYFLWILNSYFKNTTQSVEKTVAAYNWKIERVYNLFNNKSIDLTLLPDETARHVMCVMGNTKKKNWKRIIWPMLSLMLIGTMSLITVVLSSLNNKSMLFADVTAMPITNTYSDVFPCPRLEAKDASVELIDQNCKIAHVFSPQDLRAEELLHWNAADSCSFSLYSDSVVNTISAQQSRDGIIYFLLTTSGLCGSSGCSHVLYSYNTVNKKIAVIETDVNRVIRILLSPDGKKIAIASASSHDICGSNSYLRVIDLMSLDKKIIDDIDDQELQVTHIQNLRWLSNDILMFSTRHNSNCYNFEDIKLVREKEFIYNTLFNTLESRLIRERISNP